jgi:hypothetical protein
MSTRVDRNAHTSDASPSEENSNESGFSLKHAAFKLANVAMLFGQLVTQDV